MLAAPHRDGMCNWGSGAADTTNDLADGPVCAPARSPSAPQQLLLLQLQPRAARVGEVQTNRPRAGHPGRRDEAAVLAQRR